MGFYIELPEDKHGNPYYAYTVIEALPDSESDRFFGFSRYRVLGPPEFTSRWKEVGSSSSRWVETEGPARSLTRDEWLAIVQRHSPTSTESDLT